MLIDEGKVMKAKVVFALLLMAGMDSASATLISRGPDMVYDTDLNITWMANADLSGGNINWFDAQNWIATLNAASYYGYSDWRLPTTPQDCFSNQCVGNELAHLFFIEFGAQSGQPFSAGANSTNLALFSNIQADYYWYGTSYWANNNYAWVFGMQDGGLTAYGKIGGQVYDNLFAWAVRTGDVAAVPEPASMALVGIGLFGLGWTRRKRVSKD
jgi:Protein of unknown function (DUF1566)/PEP-CTERM motif